MELTAAPIVRRARDDMPAPGYTDFRNIYIAHELNASEYRTVLRHEQGHVWARHNSRRPKVAGEKRWENSLWKIACELEIARNIYDDEDIASILAPRSRLKGAYVPNTIAELPPELLLAEEIYEWLLDRPEYQPIEIKICCTNCSSSDSDEQEAEGIDAGEVLKACREQLDAQEAQSKSQAAIKKNYEELKKRQPSLTEAVEAALRVRIEREKSYRRPSRRYNDTNVLAAGAVSTPRPPLVEIFVDRSGSFTPEKTAVAEHRLKQLLERYGGSIRSDVWFFSNGKLVSDDPDGGGDTPYDLIVHHLAKTQPKLAIIITDNDPVPQGTGKVDSKTKVLCVPIACSSTQLANVIGGIDVSPI